MQSRFYAPEALASGDLVVLPQEEGEHLTRVLRMKAGDALRVFNGRGAEFDARVETTDARRVAVRVGEARPPAAEPHVALTLAQAVLKGEKMDEVVRDAVMMGVAAIQPLLTARTEVSRATLDRGRRRERWERIAIAAAKQCGRAVVPPILEPLPFDMLPAAVNEMRLPGLALMLVEPGAPADTVTLGDVEALAPRDAMVIVGPEGGWTPEEISAAAGACRRLTMGGRTIRADAMAIVAMAALFTRWGEY